MSVGGASIFVADIDLPATCFFAMTLRDSSTKLDNGTLQFKHNVSSTVNKGNTTKAYLNLP